VEERDRPGLKPKVTPAGGLSDVWIGKTGLFVPAADM